MKSGATIEGEYLVIRVPLDRAHSVRVAMSDCPCRATKSNATKRVREWISGEIAKATAGVPDA